MKKSVIIMFSLFSIFLFGCNTTTLDIENNQDVAISENKESSNILNFLEDILVEKTSCNHGYNTEKMFLSFAILDQYLEDEKIIYNLLVKGEGMYLDNRGNISSTCGFGVPIKIVLLESLTGYELLDYEEAMDGNLYTSSIKKMFSSKAIQNMDKSNYSFNTDKSPLQRAEEYFGLDFWTGGNFNCLFCDKIRYYTGEAWESKVKDGIIEGYQIFTTDNRKIDKKNKTLMFYSDGRFEIKNSRDEGAGVWIFGKDEKTILVDTYPDHTYDRYILQFLSDNEIWLTREILHK